MRFLAITLPFVMVVLLGMLGVVSVVGCSEAETEVVPVEDEDDFQEVENKEVGLPEGEAREKAVAIVKKKYQKIKEFIEEYQKNPDPDVDMGDALNRIDMEETGLSGPDISALLDIHLEEKPEDLELETTVGFRLEDLIVEYLRLSFQYPEKTKEELLELFREAVKSGETEVNARTVSEMYDLR